MSTSTLGRRYARAVLSIAKEENAVPLFKTQFQDLAAAWSTSPELRAVFENPEFGPEARRSVIDGLATKMGLAPTVVRTLKLLSDRRRIRDLPEVIETFQQLAEEFAGQVRAEVTTAKDMPEAYFTELGAALERVTGRKVILDKKIDPALIGGVVARVGDKVFDGSLRHRLQEMKDSLLS